MAPKVKRIMTQPIVRAHLPALQESAVVLLYSKKALATCINP